MTLKPLLVQCANAVLNSKNQNTQSKPDNQLSKVDQAVILLQRLGYMITMDTETA